MTTALNSCVPCIICKARRTYTEASREGDVSQKTRSSIRIHKAWQAKCVLFGCESEYQVGDTLCKFDLFDKKESTVYEMKVSGKNPGHEFYKDIVKVMIHNRCSGKRFIEKFIFLTETGGIESLRRGMFPEVEEIMKELEVSIELVPLD